MKLLLVISFILSSTISFAKLNRSLGEWGSGGGNGLVCFTKTIIANGDVRTNIITEIKKNDNTIPDRFLEHIESIEMFDLFEAKKRRGLDSKNPEILEIRDDEKIYEYFDRMGKRFKNKLYIMDYMVEAGKELIPDTQLIFHNFAVKYQNDLGSVTLPSSNCIIATMAAQVNYNDFYEVHIDERLFNHPKHSKQSKATLILHELVYALARKHFDHKDSGATRNVLRYFISYHDSFTEGTIAKALNDLDFMSTEIRVAPEVDKARYSDIMGTIEGYLLSTQSNMERALKYAYRSPENTLLLAEIEKKFLDENLPVPNEIGFDFVFEEKIIFIGLNQSSHHQEWVSIHERFRLMTNLYISGFQKDIIEDKISLLAHIKKETFITSVDYNNLLIRIDSLMDNYFSGNISWISDIIYQRRDEVSFKKEIFNEVLQGTICTSSTQSGPVIVNPDEPTSNKPDLQCYDPVKLNNIIPRA